LIDPDPDSDFDDKEKAHFYLDAGFHRRQRLWRTGGVRHDVCPVTPGGADSLLKEEQFFKNPALVAP